jgi:long-chain acyl-CoA synthetase
VHQLGSHLRGVHGVAQAFPDRVAIVEGDRRITYGELDARANGFAVELAGLSVKQGDAVGVMLRNRAEWFVVSHAVARLGAVLVPLSYRFSRREVDDIVADSGLRVLVAEDAAVLSADEAVTVIPVQSPLLAKEEASPPTPEFLRTAPASMGYTSGTTGRPKGVERPAPVPVPEATTSLIAAFFGYGPHVVQLVCGPLYHTGPSAYAEYALWEGGLVVMQDGFRGDHCLSLVEAHRVTHAFMVPAHFVRILDADWRRYDRSSVRTILHAAAPCPVSLKRRIMEVFPPGSVWEFYGATEGMGTVISPGEWLVKQASVGRPFPGVRVRILDEDGNELPPGEVGLIYLSPLGGYEFAYRGDPDKTKAAYRDGFFTVGDLGSLDEDGYLSIADRRTDLIVSGGVNIYPAEVEAALVEDPWVADAAVIGLSDERMGQRVHAIVVLRAGCPEDASAILARLRERLADYKCPRTIEFVAELPREPTGKLRRHELRAARQAGAPQKGGEPA